MRTSQDGASDATKSTPIKIVANTRAPIIRLHSTACYGSEVDFETTEFE